MERIQHVDTRDLWSQESLRKRVARAQHDRHEHEHGRRGHEVHERNNEEIAVGIDAAVLRVVKMGLVTLHMQDDMLRHHLIMHASMLESLSKVREEVHRQCQGPCRSAP